MGRHAETEEMDALPAGPRHRSPDPRNPRTPRRVVALVLIGFAILVGTVWIAWAAAPDIESGPVVTPTPASRASGDVPRFDRVPIPRIGPTSFPNDDVLGPDPLEQPPSPSVPCRCGDREPVAAPQTTAEEVAPVAPVVPPEQPPAPVQEPSEPIVEPPVEEPPVDEPPVDVDPPADPPVTDTPADEDVPVVVEPLVP